MSTPGYAEQVEMEALFDEFRVADERKIARTTPALTQEHVRASRVAHLSIRRHYRYRRVLTHTVRWYAEALVVRWLNPAGRFGRYCQ